MKIRPAKRSDKHEILSFCINTFSWGDYIDRVWDYWFRNGKLLVVEESGRKIAMSHLVICPNSNSVWLEGIRVHPDYRRSRIATELIGKMIRYGRHQGMRHASAIVDVTNVASQRMLEKNGFEKISRWAYYSTNGKPVRKKSNARLATIGELDDLWKYLQVSEIYNLSAGMYVNAWHWYVLDRTVLLNLIKGECVILIGIPIDGVVIINRRGYWDRSNILQIVYLDGVSAGSLAHLVSFVTNLYLDGEFETLQLVCNDSLRLTSYIEKFIAKDEERFFLYNKVFTTKALSSK